MGRRQESGVEGAAKDSRFVIRGLLAACHDGRRRLEIPAGYAQHPERVEKAWRVLRNCTRELAVIADALDAALVEGGLMRARARGQEVDPVEGILAAYEAALRAPLPRAVRGLLDAHCAKLREVFEMGGLAGQAA